MQVIFQTKSKNQNWYTISNVPGFGNVYFNKGVKMTSDKELIKKLMNLPQFERGDYKLVTDERLVAEYLEGKSPDKLTEKVLSNISREGMKEIGRAIGAKSEQPTLIKVEAEGKPITNEIQRIIDFYSIKDSNQEPVKEPEVVEAKVSTDMSANDAVEYITLTEADALEGFLGEEEERVTVIRAWERKFGEGE